MKKRGRKTKSASFRRKAKAAATGRKARELRARIKGMTVSKLYLDSGGYADKGRRYFGHSGLPVYRVWSADGYESIEVRARNAQEAKERALSSSRMWRPEDGAYRY